MNGFVIAGAKAGKSSQGSLALQPVRALLFLELQAMKRAGFTSLQPLHQPGLAGPVYQLPLPALDAPSCIMPSCERLCPLSSSFPPLVMLMAV